MILQAERAGREPDSSSCVPRGQLVSRAANASLEPTHKAQYVNSSQIFALSCSPSHGDRLSANSVFDLVEDSHDGWGGAANTGRSTALETYLTHHRPVLAHGSQTPALWVGGAGRALAEHTIRQTIIGRTQAVLGVPISPHLFRDCAATSLAIEDPAHVGAAATILGHASGRTTHKHYIRPIPWQPAAAT